MLIIAAMLATLAPAAAQAWRAWNRHEVYPVGNGAFEVIGRAGSGPRQFWCAAGDFARHVLGAGNTVRIYIVRGRGPAVTVENRKSVVFSLQPPPGDLPPESYSLSVDRVGDNLSASFARQYCLDPDMVTPFRFPFL